MLSLRITVIIFISFLLSVDLAIANPLESLVMPGEVIEGHKKYESECSNCHEVFSKKSQKVLCLKCHKKVNYDVKRNVVIMAEINQYVLQNVNLAILNTKAVKQMLLSLTAQHSIIIKLILN